MSHAKVDHVLRIVSRLKLLPHNIQGSELDNSLFLIAGAIENLADLIEELRLDISELPKDAA